MSGSNLANDPLVGIRMLFFFYKTCRTNRLVHLSKYWHTYLTEKFTPACLLKGRLGRKTRKGKHYSAGFARAKHDA